MGSEVHNNNWPTIRQASHMGETATTLLLLVPVVVWFGINIHTIHNRIKSIPIIEYIVVLFCIILFFVWITSLAAHLVRPELANFKQKQNYNRKWGKTKIQLICHSNRHKTANITLDHIHTQHTLRQSRKSIVRKISFTWKSRFLCRCLGQTDRM